MRIRSLVLTVCLYGCFVHLSTFHHPNYLGQSTLQGEKEGERESRRGKEGEGGGKGDGGGRMEGMNEVERVQIRMNLI